MLLVFTHPGGVKLSAGWALVVLAAGEASVVIPITAHLSLSGLGKRLRNEPNRPAAPARQHTYTPV